MNTRAISKSVSAIKMFATAGSVGYRKRTFLRNDWEMERQAQNINLIRSVWRRVKKPIKVRDLQPVKDVKGGGGVTGKSKSTTDSTDAP
jgi:hypothetical protein